MPRSPKIFTYNHRWKRSIYPPPTGISALSTFLRPAETVATTFFLGTFSLVLRCLQGVYWTTWIIVCIVIHSYWMRVLTSFFPFKDQLELRSAGTVIDGVTLSDMPFSPCLAAVGTELVRSHQASVKVIPPSRSLLCHQAKAIFGKRFSINSLSSPTLEYRGRLFPPTPHFNACLKASFTMLFPWADWFWGGWWVSERSTR